MAKKGKYQFLRGPKSNLASLSLDVAEPAITSDNGELYVGIENDKKQCIGPFWSSRVNINPTTTHTAENRQYIEADCRGGSVSINLPSGQEDGARVKVVDLYSAATPSKSITITAATGDTIYNTEDDEFVMDAPGGSITFTYNSTAKKWCIEISGAFLPGAYNVTPIINTDHFKYVGDNNTLTLNNVPASTIDSGYTLLNSGEGNLTCTINTQTLLPISNKTSALFTVSSNEITLNSDGIYNINFNGSITGSTATACNCHVIVLKNNTEIIRNTKYLFGSGILDLNAVCNLVADDVLKIMLLCDDIEMTLSRPSVKLSLYKISNT